MPSAKSSSAGTRKQASPKRFTSKPDNMTPSDGKAAAIAMHNPELSARETQSFASGPKGKGRTALAQ